MNNQNLDEKSTRQTEDQKTTESVALAKKLDVTGWGLFFIWIGIAFLANFGFAIGLLGVGIITLGGQVARKHFNLKAEGFWVVVGLLFVLGGIWELLQIKFSLVPILIIVAGVVMLVSALWGKRLLNK